MTTSNPAIELTIRAATLADAPAVANLINACTQLEEGLSTANAEDLQRFWQAPHRNLANDIFLAFTAEEEELVGYGWVSHMDPHVNVWSGVRVHPNYRGQGIGTHLIGLTEERARQALELAPAEARVAIKREIYQTNTAGRDLVIKQGYESTRYYWRMAIDLDKPVKTPQFPAAVRIRTADLNTDIPALANAVNDIFRDHYGHVDVPEDKLLENWQHWVNSDKSIDPALWFLAVTDTPQGEEIIGVSICLPKLPEDADMAYVEILGVKRDWRRQGIALNLLRHSFRAFRSRDIPRASLHVDAASLTGATVVYERAGMHADRQYEEFTKVLRAGEDLTTQSVD